MATIAESYGVKLESEMLVTAFVQWSFLAEIAARRASASGDVDQLLRDAETLKVFKVSVDLIARLMTDEELATAESLRRVLAATVFPEPTTTTPTTEGGVATMTEGETLGIALCRAICSLPEPAQKDTTTP